MATPGTGVIGCILAGGASRRMGQSKAALTLAGVPVLRWLMDRLSPAGIGQWWLSLSPEAALPAGGEAMAKVIHDHDAFRGPLAGMASVLAQAGDHIVVFLAVDMPLLRPADVRRLLDLLGGDASAGVAMSRWAGGELEPLPCVLRARLMASTVARLAGQDRAGPRDLAALAETRFAGLDQQRDAAAWVNVNRPGDWTAVLAQLDPDADEERR